MKAIASILISICSLATMPAAAAVDHQACAQRQFQSAFQPFETAGPSGGAVRLSGVALRTGAGGPP